MKTKACTLTEGAEKDAMNLDTYAQTRVWRWSCSELHHRFIWKWIPQQGDETMQTINGAFSRQSLAAP